MFKGLSLKQKKQFFLESESPTLNRLQIQPEEKRLHNVR